MKRPRLRTLRQIIRHIRDCVGNPSVNTTLIQTEELTRLCDAAEGKGKGKRKPPRKGPRPPTRHAA